MELRRERTEEEGKLGELASSNQRMLLLGVTTTETENS